MPAAALVVAACGVRWRRAALLRVCSTIVQGSAMTNRRLPVRLRRPTESSRSSTRPDRLDICATTAAGRAAGRPITHALQVAQSRRLGHILGDRIQETYSHVAAEVEQRLLEALNDRWDKAVADNPDQPAWRI